jgi:hypothetical protein
MHRLAHVVRARPQQRKAHAGLVEMRLELRRTLEAPDIKLSGYSSATSALSVIGFVMRIKITSVMPA